jgi:hypothetical protein
VRKETKYFLSGFLAGAFLLLVVFSGLTGMAASRGVAVYLDSGEIAQIIHDRIVAQAKTDFPRVIEEAKAEIPEIVEKEMAGQFASDRMEIAGFVFRMPEELVEQLRANLRRNVESATAQILDGIDTDELADKLGEDAFLLVREAMENEFSGQSMQVMLFKRIPVRVNIFLE